MKEKVGGNLPFRYSVVSNAAADTESGALRDVPSTGGEKSVPASEDSGVRRFALSLPPPKDERFDAVVQHLLDTVSQEAMRLRTKCAIANGVTMLETVATVEPDPNQPNVVIVTARVRGTG